MAKAVRLSDLEGSYSAFAFGAEHGQLVEGGLKIFEKYNKTRSGPRLQRRRRRSRRSRCPAIERAIGDGRRLQADREEGRAIDALEGPAFGPEHFQGLLKSVQFTKAAPFPTTNLAVKAVTVKDGKVVPVSTDWMAVPELAKW